MRTAFACALLAVATPAAAAPDLCALLTPADFTAAGVTGARAPARNGTGDDWYCVYAGKSSATGGIEADIFIASDAKEAKGLYNEVRGAPGKAASIPGVDQAEIADRREPAAFTTITVRRHYLVFSIGVPTNAKSQDAVITLAKVALQRAGTLGQ